MRGRFVERPHRFAARVDVESVIVEAHLANPGRLTGVLAPGCKVALEGPFSPPRALPYTMLAARTGRVWAGTVTTYANRIFPLLLQAGVFPELLGDSGWRAEAAPGGRNAGLQACPSARLKPGTARPEPRTARLKPCTTTMQAARTIRSEVVHGRSRFDFEVAGRLVEVKSVSLADGHAGLFPDAVTARGARHCDELAALAHRGRPTAIVFVAQRADIESVAAAKDIDPVFSRSLCTAAKAGVLVLACALRMTPRGATAARRVPVLL
jgi:sugar fermentation stimulation protein A